MIHQSEFSNCARFTCRESQSIDIKEEPSSPDVEVCPVFEVEPTSVDTLLSPTTLINSFLQDEMQPTPVTTTTTATTPAGI